MSSSSTPSKKSSDRHLKVDGKDRRVKLPSSSTQVLYEVSKRLGHRTIGQTIEWLLVQAKPSVDAVLGTNVSTSNPNVAYNPFGFDAPFVPVVASASMINPYGEPSSFTSNDGLDKDVNISAEDMAKILSEFA